MIKYVAILGLVFLAACGGRNSIIPAPVETIVIDAQPIERPILSVPEADKFIPRKYEWIIVTPDTIDEIFAEFQKEGRPMALFALTDEGYRNISINSQNALKIIKQKNSIIQAYVDYYHEADSVITEHNENR